MESENMSKLQQFDEIADNGTKQTTAPDLQLVQQYRGVNMFCEISTFSSTFSQYRITIHTAEQVARLKSKESRTQCLNR